MEAGELNIMVAGEAGQGLATIGQLLAKSLVKSGLMIHVTQSYHSRIRGGHNTYVVRTSPEAVLAPLEQVDLLLALNSDGVEMHRDELSDRGLMLADPELGGPEGRTLAVPFKDLAEKRYWNTVGLGVIGALIGLDQELLAGLLAKALKKHPEAVEPNKQALGKAYEWTAEQDSDFPKMPKGTGGEGRLMLNGNEAIALGAISAGAKACFFYPMTPSTSIALTMAAAADKMGLVVEQMEDEIAAVNTALGASYAGAPSLVSTSGGGFALMVEGISLAGMTETPLVVALSQRPGPATGLPTRTAQEDLDLVLHAGHGEFPRAIFAPGTPEECFHTSRRAFALAERFQSPCFILTDQYLADSYRGVDPFDVDNLDACGTWQPVEGEDPDYQRYTVTVSGVSGRRLPGFGKALVVADSDEHTPDGHITEDLSVRMEMQQKRMRKLEGLWNEVLPPTMEGPEDAEILLVCWGSSYGATREASQRLREHGMAAGLCHFSQVWPLDPSQFLDRFSRAGRMVVVEGNYQGQFARLLLRETGIGHHGAVLRFDGLPFTADYILQQLNNE
jgi:2-oxoglutarate ferredoxin oxidoreductase subunit alpha